MTFEQLRQGTIECEWNERVSVARVRGNKISSVEDKFILEAIQTLLGCVATAAVLTSVNILQ